MTLDIAKVQQQLDGSCTVEHYAELTSTNDRARELAQLGHRNVLISADFQTEGRGRRGAMWFAPANSSVLCSLLLRCDQPLPPHYLTILAGVGVAKGLQAQGVPVKIKWPNDLMLQERKIAGILIETLGDALIIGVGVNCNIPREVLPDALRDRAGSVEQLCTNSGTREAILTALVDSLLEAHALATSGQMIKLLLDWNAMNWFSKRKVRVTSPLGVVDGDGLFLDGRKFVFHVFKDCGVVTMPLSSTVEGR